MREQLYHDEHATLRLLSPQQHGLTFEGQDTLLWERSAHQCDASGFHVVRPRSFLDCSDSSSMVADILSATAWL